MKFFLLYAVVFSATPPLYASRDWGNKFLKVVSISCSKGEINSRYHLDIGQEINEQILTLDYRIHIQKEFPVLLSKYGQNWILSAHFSPKYRDPFPCNEDAALVVNFQEVSR